MTRPRPVLVSAGLAAGFLVAAGCSGGPEAAPGAPGASPAPPDARGASPVVRLERVSAAVPWPRGLHYREGRIVVVARGRHRREGPPHPAIRDQGGTLFTIDPAIAEPVVPGEPAGEAVRENAEVLARPTEPPFRLWEGTAEAPAADARTDRPYCNVAWDEASGSYFLCSFSGIDGAGPGRFRKNATDGLHRYDTRTGRWHTVEAHDPGVVPAGGLGHDVPSQHYPHHDPSENPPPHGWLNGPDGCDVAGRYLYASAKDNSVLARYDLAPVRADPEAGPPPSEVVLGDEAPVLVEGRRRRLRLQGHSAVRAGPRGDFLYVAFRTTSQVVRFPLEPDGSLERPVTGELIARFDPLEDGCSADLIDLAFDPEGALYVATKQGGHVWRVGPPDPARVFDGRAGSSATPYADLRELSGEQGTTCANICFDPQGRLYVATGDDATPEDRLSGVIYRVTRGG